MTSRYARVTLVKGGKWQAQPSVDGKTRYVGYFQLEDLAGHAVDKCVRQGLHQLCCLLSAHLPRSAADMPDILTRLQGELQAVWHRRRHPGAGPVDARGPGQRGRAGGRGGGGWRGMQDAAVCACRLCSCLLSACTCRRQRRSTCCAP